MKKIVFPGLALYALSSGLGLFLHAGLSSRYLIPWLTGFVFLIFIVSYLALFGRRRVDAFAFFVLGVIGLNFLIQTTGGASSPFLPLYFLVTTAAALQQNAWLAYPVTVLILAIEALNLMLSGRGETAPWHAYAAFAASLSGVTFIIALITHRMRRAEKAATESYQKLVSDADAVDPLAGGANIEALTDKKRQARNVNSARAREKTFSDLIGMISELVPAHTYALFLDDRSNGVFSLRGIRSRSGSVASMAEFANGKGLIGICAARNQPQYLQDVTVPIKSLGYYTQEAPVRSFLAIPMAAPGTNRVVGVLCVDSLERNAFSPEIQNTLRRAVPFFLQTIENMRISGEMDIRAKNFAALHEMSQILSSSLDIAEVLDQLTARIRSVVPYDFCVFLLYDEQAGEAVISAIRGYDNRFVNTRFPTGQSAIFANMLNQWKNGHVSIHHNPDLGDRGREIGLFPIKELQHPIKSLYGRPLVARGKFIGAVFLSSLRTNAFTEYHLNFMDTLLNHASMVVDNSMLHKRIRAMAHTDGLTGLLNHRTFMDKLDAEFKRLDREYQHFSLLLLDIDWFKKVNDEHGHPVGDAALKTVAGVIRDTARSIDFVARYGGEEFAVGMVGAGTDGAKIMAERIRKAVEHTTIAAGKVSLKRTVSIGVASYFRGCDKKETLIALADRA
ncbi:MAG TPA: diguanylate cyclase, partial [Nitrospirota bacterium]